MKPFVIAATTLAFAGTAFAQAVTPPPPTLPVEQVQDAATAAEKAAAQAGDAADKAAQAAEQAVEQGGAAAADAANAAAQAADAAGDAASDAAGAAAKIGSAPDAAPGDAVPDAARDAAESAADAAADAAAVANDAAAEASAATDAATTPMVAAPDVQAPPISEAAPGVLSSWVTSRRIWTTNQPSTTAWVAPTVNERPAEWQDIAKVNDIVMDESGQVMGYVADIGGFLGIGAKKVLLGKDAIHLVSIAENTFFLTNYTKAELEALPDFDEKTVRK